MVLDIGLHPSLSLAFVELGFRCRYRLLSLSPAHSASISLFLSSFLENSADIDEEVMWAPHVIGTVHTPDSSKI